ncbi:MAG TPA: Rieske (2Fe-2S) protein [Verrucomicrobiota bacterium]|nr:Rieske (2Fe-2S) protein [Verrucomicrobiota bacterium]
MSEPQLESGADPTRAVPPAKVGRRQMLMTVGIALNAIAGALFAIPIVGYLLAPASRRARAADLDWVALGPLTQFPVGETRLATYRNPETVPWDGATGEVACWVRRVTASQWQVFAVNCAHLGCPVRWFPQSKLFMCPCHGGVYYADGSRASGPPPRGLFQYDYKIEGEQLWIKAGQMPTLASPPSVASTGQPRNCSCA